MWPTPSLRLILVSSALLSVASPSALSADFFVSLSGNDSTGDGSASNPWRTIARAVNSGIPAAGGDSVLVMDGEYSGMTMITRGFSAPVSVRAQNTYRARLTNIAGGMEAIRVYVNGSANLTIEGFVISNFHPTNVCSTTRQPYFLIHISDASDVTLRNNVIYGNNAPGTCNEVIKVNRSADAYPKNIVIQGNVIYDPANSEGADLLDSVRPGELDITDNVFWGNSDRTSSQSFITLKRQVVAAVSRSPRYRIARNIFMNWGGKTDQAFLQLGEDGVAEYEITDALIENNLFIGNSPATIAAPVQLKGVKGVIARANTIVGDLPSGAFGFRIGTEGSNPRVEDVSVRNNIFSDPTGTMSARLFTIYGSVLLESVTLSRNLFWNAGNGLPSSGAILPTADASRIEGDPKFPAAPVSTVLPRWNEASKQFESGATTIRDEFLRLASTYGALGEGSSAIGAADSTNMPALDIRGAIRDSTPDVGAFELGAIVPSAPPTNDPVTDVVETPVENGSVDSNSAGGQIGSGGCSSTSGGGGLVLLLTCALIMIWRGLTVGRAFSHKGDLKGILTTSWQGSLYQGVIWEAERAS